MTFAVVRGENPFLSELIALAFESAGHDCLVFRDVDDAARVLESIRVDSIVMDVHLPGRSGLDWLETMIGTWPDLPSRTLLLADTDPTVEEAKRIRQLGADVGARPSSLHGVMWVVMGRLRRARSEPAGGARRELDRAISVEMSY